jgi:glyoxylase-like metal-dependent hydrolase (beta-lactamase superfamily II)
MQTLAAGMAYFDLHFRGRPGVIASGFLHGPGGVAIVDPGPSSTLPALHAALKNAGASVADVTDILLTHIHLDHAGATGTLVKERPAIRVFVHEQGAPHLADPSKLVASATRLYGDAMERLWGEILPVAPGSLRVLKGGEAIDVCGRRYDVVYTPGHANHHVSYFCAETRVAFVGDTAGVKMGARGMVVPPTPPPDIDLEIWRDSIARIEDWNAETLLISHFGAITAPAVHLTELRDHLALVGRLAKASLDVEGDDEAKTEWYVEQMRREVRRHVGDADPAAYETAGRFDLNWRGLARYWRKKSGA